MLLRLSKSDFEKFFYSRWILVACTGLIMFANHYARDAVGALENQMEKDLMISVHDYASINAVYFLPSVFSPILAGMFVHKIGGPNCLLYSVLAGCFGHVLFSFGVQYDNINLLLFGRSIAGFMYEIIDSMPFLLCTPHFTSEWGLVVGLLNGFLRLGSVMNFVISPLVYKSNGVKAALWLATLIFSSSILFSIAIKIKLYKGNSPNDYQKINIDQDNIVAEEIIDVEQRKPLNETVLSPDSLPISDELDLALLSTDIDDCSIAEKGNNFELLPPEEVDPNSGNDLIKKNFIEKVKSLGISIFDSFATALPLHQFSSQYYMFLLSGAFLYGSMVPFWFLGSKFLQDNYMLSVQNADALMLFPEGFIAIVAVPLGLILDKYQRSTKERLLMLASACLLLPMSYIMLAYGFCIENPISNNTGDLSTPEYTDIQSNRITIISPTLSMCVIGIAYSISNCLYWSSVLEIFPKDRNHLAAANGLLAGSVNILPSVVSPFLVFISTFDSKESSISVRFPIHLLSGLGVCSSLFALLASLYMNPSLIPSPVIEDSSGAIELEKIETKVFEK